MCKLLLAGLVHPTAGVNGFGTIHVFAQQNRARTVGLFDIIFKGAALLLSDLNQYCPWQVTPSHTHSA
jgi:hypothetical protein